MTPDNVETVSKTTRILKKTGSIGLKIFAVIGVLFVVLIGYQIFRPVPEPVFDHRRPGEMSRPSPSEVAQSGGQVSPEISSKYKHAVTLVDINPNWDADQIKKAEELNNRYGRVQHAIDLYYRKRPEMTSDQAKRSLEMIYNAWLALYDDLTATFGHLVQSQRWALLVEEFKDWYDMAMVEFYIAERSYDMAAKISQRLGNWDLEVYCWRQIGGVEGYKNIVMSALGRQGELLSDTPVIGSAFGLFM